ncbi:aromatic prenyltransferase [Streptomyces sp. NPDC052236]|uniref:aromatic prenyltransferase n=1 Tax=Streptomyces sp. NPDC052236 TaxID=3365686 RepID=UPI0037CD3CC6
MSVGTATEELYSAIEESARLVGAACSRDKVWPILTAYGNPLTEGRIVFSAQTGEGRAGELEYTFEVSPGIDDPYAHALSNGFIAGTDHPVGSLISDIQAKIPVNEYLVDCGVTGGFKKIYPHFPQDLQAVAKLAEIPSMPPAVAENLDFFTRYGLNDVALIGIDYRRKTMNVYFQLPPAGNLEPKTILAMLREIGLPEPDERMLEYASKSYRIYTTFSWDSSKTQRISFAPSPRRSLDLSALPARPEPEIEQFMRSAPYTYAGERICVSVVKWSPDGEALDFGAYYQLSPPQLKAMMGTREEPV